MPQAITPAGHAQRARAAALGISLNALKKRESYARRTIEARRAAWATKPKPEVPAWIGARIWPPLEADHPSLTPREP